MTRGLITVDIEVYGFDWQFQKSCLSAKYFLTRLIALSAIIDSSKVADSPG